MRSRRAWEGADAWREDGPPHLRDSTQGSGGDVRRRDQPDHGARGADRLDPPEGGNGHQARPQHPLHRGDGRPRQSLRQSDGRLDGAEPEAARPRRAHRDGSLRPQSRGRARGALDRHRHGAAEGRARRSKALARAGTRPAAKRGRRSSQRATMTDTLAVGVMSGTSLDGISTALVRLTENAAQLVAFRQEPYSAAERGSIIDTMARGTPKDVAFLHVALGERFAGAVLGLLAQARVSPKNLSFIASHGQTIWHEPGRADLPPRPRPG